MKLLNVLARRFVAGENPLDAIQAARRVNGRGIKAIIDFLGEDVSSREMADAAGEEYKKLLSLIKHEKVEAAVSVKASQMGLLISREVCLTNLEGVLRIAQQNGNFVWMDMEGSALTQKTIEVFETLRAGFPNIGLCLQAYLVRTGGELDRLMRGPHPADSSPLAIRLCKGAYKEPPEIALAGKPAVDGNFRMLAQKLLDRAGRGVFPAFATHDMRLIDAILSAARDRNIAAADFEFQMLYGIQNNRLEGLARQGYQTRVYIPYGRAWLPYFLRRLRERRENVYFLMRNLFRM